MIVEVRRQLCGVTSLLYLCGFHQISRLAGKLYPLSNLDVPALFFVEEKPVAKCGPFMASTKSLEAKGFWQTLYWFCWKVMKYVLKQIFGSYQFSSWVALLFYRQRSTWRHLSLQLLLIVPRPLLQDSSLLAYPTGVLCRFQKTWGSKANDCAIYHIYIFISESGCHQQGCDGNYD